MCLPIIGISGDLALSNFYSNFWVKRSGVNHDYVTSVTKSGAIPIILPITSNKNVGELVKKIDGLILTGGDDVTPLLYGEEPLLDIKELNPERDYFEMTLLREAINQKKPILAICRGLQLLNVAFGGTLYQDLSQCKDTVQQHVQKSDPHIPFHSVVIQKDSFIHSILGDEFMVNSLHHQMVKDIAPEFKVVALSKDNVIEAIEMIENPNVIGIQWHPEMMAETSEKMQDIFNSFTQMTKNNKKGF